MYIRCPNCQYQGKAKKITKGSIGVEILLWLFFIIPGLIYSVWRVSSRYDGCPKCGYQFVVKLKEEEVDKAILEADKLEAQKEPQIFGGEIGR